VPAEEGISEPLPEDALTRVASLEEEFRLTIASRLQVPQGGPAPTEWFRWANQLRNMTEHLQGLDHWRQIEEHMISPAVAQLAQMLDQSLQGPIHDVWQAWLERYLPALELLLQAMRGQAARQSQAASNRVAAALNPHLPVARRSENLSRKALWVLRSTPGVTTVLLGMRHPDYVSDALEVMKWPPLGQARAVYEALAEVRPL